MDVAVSMTSLPVRQRGVACCQELVTGDQGWAQETAEILKALAEPTRLNMVAALWAADAPVCVCDFTAALELSQPTISHHMGKLRAAGLVESTKQGVWVYYRLRDDLPAATVQLLETLVEPATQAALTTSVLRSDTTGPVVIDQRAT
ncbi:MAG: transcriptional regulator [Candidatus Nephthysia bennettiae]|uniref:Helix-turn-helix transcriptional regulator n=2 Tax=Candidatus Nephthysia bennettiae TaxID=3127016 RepID=A0A934N2B6_9BACT|nr:helix-turn-helix transcriptional regulator [Candidatus Dormibacteraeota bacterium]PZR95839.1 MAG: transcriptional regulator [Candidatus Dormibacteraeota bacterium]